MPETTISLKRKFNSPMHKKECHAEPRPDNPARLQPCAELHTETSNINSPDAIIPQHGLIPNESAHQTNHWGSSMFSRKNESPNIQGSELTALKTCLLTFTLSANAPRVELKEATHSTTRATIRVASSQTSPNLHRKISRQEKQNRQVNMKKRRRQQTEDIDQRMELEILIQTSYYLTQP